MNNFMPLCSVYIKSTQFNGPKGKKETEMSTKMVCPWCESVNDDGLSNCTQCGGSLNGAVVATDPIEPGLISTSDSNNACDDWDKYNRERIEEIEQDLEEAWRGYNPTIEIMFQRVFALVIVLFWLVMPRFAHLVFQAGMPTFVGVIPAILVTTVLGLGILKFHLRITSYRMYVNER